jgi:hypothetical protein
MRRRQQAEKEEQENELLCQQEFRYLIGSFSISHRIFPKIFEYAESADILEFGP